MANNTVRSNRGSGQLFFLAPKHKKLIFSLTAGVTNVLKKVPGAEFDGESYWNVKSSIPVGVRNDALIFMSLRAACITGNSHHGWNGTNFMEEFI